MWSCGVLFPKERRSPTWFLKRREEADGPKRGRETKTDSAESLIALPPVTTVETLVKPSDRGPGDYLNG